MYKDFSVLPSLGIIIENAGLYPNLTGIQNLTYLASLTERIGQEEIIHAITRVGLDPDDKRIYRKYSMGMKQRLAVAQAIMEVGTEYLVFAENVSEDWKTDIPLVKVYDDFLITPVFSYEGHQNVIMPASWCKI